MMAGHTAKGRISSMRKMKKINGYLVVKFNDRELDAALDNLDAEGAPALALRKALRERVGELAEMFDGNFAVKQYRKEARS